MLQNVIAMLLLRSAAIPTAVDVAGCSLQVSTHKVTRRCYRRPSAVRQTRQRRRQCVHVPRARPLTCSRSAVDRDCKTIACSIASSRFDYCNSLLSGSPSTQSIVLAPSLCYAICTGCQWESAFHTRWYSSRTRLTTCRRQTTSRGCCSVMCQPGLCGLPSHLYYLLREPRPTLASGLSASLHH